MLSVVCVEVSNYQGRGGEYVRALRAMVGRHLAQPLRFLCLTDSPDGHGDGVECLPVPPEVRGLGWFAKLALFQPGLFPDGTRVLAIDLDTLVTASIDDLAAYDGPFAGLGDFRNGKGPFASGLMAWPAGSATHIWTEWLRRGRPQHPGGDDHFIAEVAPDARRLQRMFPGIVSYKFHHCQDGPPAGSRIIVFQRRPKPHELVQGWVGQHWKEDP